jgi:hypothetical protein
MRTGTLMVINITIMVFLDLMSHSLVTDCSIQILKHNNLNFIICFFALHFYMSTDKLELRLNLYPMEICTAEVLITKPSLL